MRVAIIGAGWVGCHLALKFKDNYEVTLFEEEGIFSKTSVRNQNRLHLGFHYARSSSTRNLCRTTFDRFLAEYGNLASDIKNNIYAVPQSDSLIDLKTYLKIFDSWNYTQLDTPYLQNIEGAIRVDEKYIDPSKAKKFFEKRLADVLVTKKIKETDLEKLKKDYDLVVNCTNNVLNKIEDTNYELNTLFIYEKISDVEFGALTLVDGQLFSIFPYLDGTYLVSHVKYSPDNTIGNDKKVELIEKDILKYFPDFKKHFKLSGSNESYKSKIKSAADPRVPITVKEDNLINVFTGKIQGIFQIEDLVKKEIVGLNGANDDDVRYLFDKYLERQPDDIELRLHTGKDKVAFEKELETCDERKELERLPRVAVLISGHPRGMNFLKTSHRISQKRVDFFIFSWDQQGNWGEETDLEKTSVRATLGQEYLRDPRIKKFAIESNKDYVRNNPTDPNITFFRYSRVPEINMQSQLYAIMRSYQLMEEYAREKGIKYDLVIKTRFEMGIKKFVLSQQMIDDVNSEKIIFFPNGKESGHTHPLPSYCTRCDNSYNQGIKVKHMFAHENPVCDTYAYGSMESMKKYCYLHEEYERLCKSFEAHNLDVIDKIGIQYKKDEQGNYIIQTGHNNDILGQKFLFCSYPERLFMYHLEDYLMPKAEHIVLGHNIS
jgi:hypothetical protein